MNEELVAKCACSQCGNHIEFPIEVAGQFVHCPHCQGATQLNLEDAARKVRLLRQGLLPGLGADTELVGILPVHVSGLMADVAALRAFAEAEGVSV